MAFGKSCEAPDNGKLRHDFLLWETSSSWTSDHFRMLKSGLSIRSRYLPPPFSIPWSPRAFRTFFPSVTRTWKWHADMSISPSFTGFDFVFGIWANTTVTFMEKLHVDHAGCFHFQQPEFSRYMGTEPRNNSTLRLHRTHRSGATMLPCAYPKQGPEISQIRSVL
ncbi:hypothetical protein BJ508DRAFT_67376 [Ascobolus immersus RN42]|uniref:Uncharacterized protein n=1 Tax=Ascobolus immersus RN42 TaxID=1160509 RepID=A0A3N4HF70_ASCIM|nr:hypothetical protein BJ508DRAFT_67376 [Ascobolus immersus RN42]